MGKNRLVLILSNCIDDIVLGGKNKEECLCKNEVMREELEPLLGVVAHIHRVTKSIQLPLNTVKSKTRRSVN